jgi:hypothetical protein
MKRRGRYWEFGLTHQNWNGVYHRKRQRKPDEEFFEVYNSETISLHTPQSLVGRLNDIALMCPFLATF